MSAAAGPMLLIGADGFAGRHLRADAVDAGLEVIGTTRTPGAAELACDLLDRASIEAALGEARPRLVANLAGAASASESWSDPRAAFEANALGTLNLLDAVAGQHPQPYVLTVSSGDIYGEVAADQLPITEERRARPLSPYAASKAAMEVVCGQYSRSAGLAIAIVRSFNHVGPANRRASPPRASPARSRRPRPAATRRWRWGWATSTSNATSPTCAIPCAPIDCCWSRTRRRVQRLLRQADARWGPDQDARHRHTLEIETIVDEGRLRPAEPAVIYGSHQRLTEASGWTPELPLAGAVAALLDDWRRHVDP